MLKNFENWLLQNNYKPTTAADYMGRIERLCRNEQFTLAHLVENIASILPQYETAGEKSSYGKRSHTSGDPLIIIYQWIGNLTGVRSVEVGQVYISPYVPCLRNLIS